MRTVKFRAFVKERGLLVDVLSINFIEKTVELPIETDVNAAYWWDKTSWSFDEVILLQYTGLEDKHGAEICEGDIVGSGWQGDIIGVVEFEEGMFLVKSGASTVYFVYPDSYEIIGNIYENPELLETLK